MPRRLIIPMIVLGVFLLAVLMVTLRRQPPEIPADRDHLEARSRSDDCLSCHGPDGPRPRGPNHPFGRNCGGCHFWVGEVR